MNSFLYSVRMRASCQGRHLAGAERIVADEALSEVVAALTSRAACRDNGVADEIVCRIESIDPHQVRYAKLPDITTNLVNDWRQGRQAAVQLLARAGVRKEIAAKAVELLAGGAGPGGVVMRGAVLMDAATGERLEVDSLRGVRASRMDLDPRCRSVLLQGLISAGLEHHRVMEALVLAGKVLMASGIVAELCWSDDPGYTTGYVSAPQAGYQRISQMKPAGDVQGGRIFFVNRAAAPLPEFVDFLQKQVVLFNAPGKISPPAAWMVADE